MTQYILKFENVCIFFFNGNLTKQLDNSLQKRVSVNPCKTSSEEQLDIPERSTVKKYGTGSLRDNAL